MFVAALTAGAVIPSGCAPHRPSASLAPLPRAPRFAVLSQDETRTEISLLDAEGTFLTWPSADAVTDVWLDATDRWEGMLAPAGIGLDAVLPYNASGGPWVTVLTRAGGRTLARFPFPAAPTSPVVPTEFATAPDFASSDTAEDGFVRDVIVRPAPAGAPRTAYVLRSAGRIPGGASIEAELLIVTLDAGAPGGGTLLGSVPLTPTDPAAAAVPVRMALVEFEDCADLRTEISCGGAPGCTWTGTGCGGGPASSDRLVIGLSAGSAPGAPGLPGPTPSGTLLVVDPSMRRVTSTLTLPGLAGCDEVAVAPVGGARAVPEARDAGLEVREVLVACGGLDEAESSTEASAGLVALRITRGEGDAGAEPSVTIDRTWTPVGATGLRPSRGLIAVPGLGAVVVSDGDADEARDDVAFLVDLDRAARDGLRLTQAPRASGDPSSGLGTGAFDPASGLLALPAGRSGLAGTGAVLRRRVRTAQLVDGSLEIVVCPSSDPACVPSEDDALAAPVALQNRLVPRSVRLVGAP